MAARCSFCDTDADAAPLFAGQRERPGPSDSASFICLDCAGRARDEPEQPPSDGDCSLCGRLGRILARTGTTAVCGGCIDICLEVSAPFVIKP